MKIDDLVSRLRRTESVSKRKMLDEAADALESMKIHIEYMMEHPHECCSFCVHRDEECNYMCSPEYVGQEECESCKL